MSDTELAKADQQSTAIVTMGFGNLQSYEFMQRTAKMFSHSSMVPAAYRNTITKGYGDRMTTEDNPAAIPNCMIALNMAQRMNADPLMIMQNLHIIEGRPSWSSQYIIAAINSCGKFSPLRFHKHPGTELEASYTTFEWENNKKKAVITKTKIVNAKCIAWAVERGTTIPSFSLDELKQYGSVYQCCKAYGVPLLESTEVSMEMAVNEGWYSKNGSKWQTMPDLMLMYRSAAFFGRIYAPEVLMGLPAAEEVQDIVNLERQADGSYSPTEAAPASAPAVPISKSEAMMAAAEAARNDPNVVDAEITKPTTQEAEQAKDVPTRTTTVASKADPATGELPAVISANQVKYLETKIKAIELPESAVAAILARIGVPTLAALNVEQFNVVKHELSAMGA